MDIGPVPICPPGNTGDGPDVLGAFTSLGNNLTGKTDASSGWIASDLTSTAANPLDPKLSPLGNFGGPTQTELPVAGSPVIDHGSNALMPPGVVDDQRGKASSAGRWILALLRCSCLSLAIDSAIVTIKCDVAEARNLSGTEIKILRCVEGRWKAMFIEFITF